MGTRFPGPHPRLGGLELGEVDLRVRDVVHEIGHEVLRRRAMTSMICPSVNPSSASREVQIAHRAARLDQALGEARRGPRFGSLGVPGG